MAALGRCGAGEGSEPENRSVLLLSATYFYVLVYYYLVDALRFCLCTNSLSFFVPSRCQFSTEHFCTLPILQSKEPPQEEISAAFLSPPKCNISDQKKSNIIVCLKWQRRNVLFPKRFCTIAKDRQSERNHRGLDPGCIEMCSAVNVLGWVCCV